MIVLFSVFTLSKSYGKVSVEQNETAKYNDNCEKSYVSVHFNDFENYLMICEGIERTENFIKDHLDYSFEEPVQILIGDVDTFTDETLKINFNESLAIYVFDHSTIVIKPWDTLKKTNYLGLPIDKNFYTSIVVHEMFHHAHYTNVTTQGSNYDLLGSEFLSSIVQIETMPEDKKTLFVNHLLGDNIHMINVDDISLAFYALKADLFIISSHSIYLENPKILQEVFNGERRIGRRFK